MASGAKKKMTVDRAKALRFISRQEFFKMQSKDEQNALIHKELKWAKDSNDNDTYAREICSFIVHRHTQLLGQSLQENSGHTDAITKYKQMQQKPHFYINAKIKDFYSAVGISQKYQYQYNESAAEPLLKRAKLSHFSNDDMKIDRTETLKLPLMLLNSKKLRRWLEDKLKILKEYETLISSQNTELDTETAQNCIRNLRRDIDILKSTVLQQHSNGLRDNSDLKRVYLDIQKMEKCLPDLRREHIKPVMMQHMKQFISCEMKQTLNTQNDIKQLLHKYKFKNEAQQFCTVHNKKVIKHLLFESANDELNDDMELLRDFGVKFVVEEERNGSNVRIIFEGHFGEELNHKKPPNLVIIVNESKYQHLYSMEKNCKQFMDVLFVLKEKRGIKRERRHNDDDDVKLDIEGHKSRFEQKHIEWLNKYKANTMKAKNNGEFVSIVNVYNFYIKAVKELSKQMSDNNNHNMNEKR